MNKIIGILICFSALACKTHPPKTEDTDLISHFNLVWEVVEKKNNPQMDHNAQIVLNVYQELLKGVASGDTAYIHATSLLLITKSDSLIALSLSQDTALRDAWKHCLGSISDEVPGIIESNQIGDTKELTNSMNMLSIQILNWLASIGYKEQNIYIFNETNEYVEDGIYWIGLQKRSKNPFNKDDKALVQAIGFLQDLK